MREGKHLYEFGPFRLDPAERSLLRDGKAVPLTPKAFELLVLLVENRGHLLKKNELIERVWPNTFVEEANLAQNVSALRKALDDKNGGAQYIETVPKGGYRFAAAVVDHIQAGGVASHAVEPLSPRLASRVAVRRALAFLATASVVVILMLAFQRGLLHLQSSGTANVPRIQSLAVLPLENLSGDSSQDYFADGMTDELITNLGQTRSLRVISRTSVMQYKGTRKPLPQIASELNVEVIVEGTVVRSGDQVRITAQLVQAKEEKHLWAQSYEGNLKDVLGLQDEIARAVAKQIRSTLTPRKEIPQGVARPANPAAYESYWKGEYFLDKLTPESVKKAADYFQDAVVKEPDYVAAYNKLAAAYQILGNMGALSKSESRSKSALAIDKALALDALSGPAHAQKGWGALLNDLDFTTAEAEFKRAVELSPNEVQGHQGLADYYAAVGQVDQAVLEMERARQVDPLSFIVNFGVCRILYFARRFDEALAQCKVNLNFDPKSQLTLWNIKAIYQAKGIDADAATVFLQAAEASGAPLDVIATLKKAQHESGLREMCKAWLLRPNQSDERREDLLTWASIYSCAGNKDKALVLLKRAIDERSFGIVWLGVDPTYDDLRSDPRFVSVLRRVGLPESQPRN